MARSLLSVSFLMSVALMFGRLSGMVREQVLGIRLGADESADAILLMLTLPDLLVALILSGGFSAVLVPVLRNADGAARKGLARRAILWAAAVGGVVALLLAGLARPALDLLAQSLDHRAIDGLDQAFRLSLMALPVGAVIGAVTAYLNAIGKFSVPAFSVVVFNLAITGYFLVMPVPVWFLGFAICLIVAMGLRLSVQALQAPGLFRPAPPAAFEPGVLRRFGQGVLGLGLAAAVPLIFRSLYSAGGDGYLAQFNFALRIYELPNAIVVGSLVTVFLPYFADTDRDGEGQFETAQISALSIAFTAALLAAAVGVTHAGTITALLFGYGQIGADTVGDISRILAILLASLPFVAMAQVASAGLNARGLTWIVMWNGIGALAVALVGYTALALSGLGPWSAILGVVLFNVSLSGLCVSRVLSYAATVALARRIAVGLVLVTLVSAVFWITARGMGPLSMGWRIALMVAQTAALALLALPQLRELQRMRLRAAT